MNKGLKVTLVILLVVILIGLVGILTYAIMNKDDNFFWSVDFDNLTDDMIVKEEKYDLTNINDIEFDFTASDVRFVVNEAGSSELRVVQYARKSIEEKYLFKTSNNSTNIRIYESNRNFQIFSFGSKKTAYIVYIPAGYVNNMTMKTVSGDIEVYGSYEFKNFMIKSTSGEIETFGDIIASSFIAKTVSGDIDITSLNTVAPTIESTSGEVSLISLIANDVTVKTVSGDIEIDDFVGGGIVKSTSGEIDINKFNILSNSEMKTISGEVTINLYDNVNCRIKTSSVSGDVVYPYNGTVLGVEPHNVLDIKTTSGDIEINQR